jgi:hypothetical protein
MQVALLSGPGNHSGRTNVRNTVGLWVRVKVFAPVALAGRDEWRPEKRDPCLAGSKDPSVPKPKRRPFRRGTRGGSRSAPYQRRILSRLALPRKKAPPKSRGSGSRTRHFVAALEKSVLRWLPVANQCLDIKRLAELRRLNFKRTGDRSQKPFMQPRAEAGLSWRQGRLTRASVHWGNSYAKVFRRPADAGRRYWRDRLFKQGLITKRQGVLFPDGVESLYASYSPSERLGQEPLPERPAPPRLVCICMYSSSGASCRVHGPGPSADYIRHGGRRRR